MYTYHTELQVLSSVTGMGSSQGQHTCNSRGQRQSEVQSFGFIQRALGFWHPFSNQPMSSRFTLVLTNFGMCAQYYTNMLL